jgi:hypothetical protein
MKKSNGNRPRDTAVRMEFPNWDGAQQVGSGCDEGHSSTHVFCHNVFILCSLVSFDA